MPIPRTAPAEKADLVPEQLLALSHYDNEDVQLEFVRNSENTSEVTLSLKVSLLLLPVHGSLRNKYPQSLALLVFVLIQRLTAPCLAGTTSNQTERIAIRDSTDLGYKGNTIQADDQQKPLIIVR